MIVLFQTGKKPCACEFCGQEFTQSGSRSVHVKKNHLQELTMKKLQVKQPVIQQRQQLPQMQTVGTPLPNTLSEIVLMAGDSATTVPAAGAVVAAPQPQQLVFQSLGDGVVLYQQPPPPSLPPPSPSVQEDRPLCGYQGGLVVEMEIRNKFHLSLRQVALLHNAYPGNTTCLPKI